MTLTDVGVDSGMSVGVGGVTGTPVAIGSTVGDGLGAMVGTAMVDVGCGVGLVTTEVSEHANPKKTIIKFQSSGGGVPPQRRLDHDRLLLMEDPGGRGVGFPVFEVYVFYGSFIPKT